MSEIDDRSAIQIGSVMFSVEDLAAVICIAASAKEEVVEKGAPHFIPAYRKAVEAVEQFNSEE